MPSKSRQYYKLNTAKKCLPEHENESFIDIIENYDKDILINEYAANNKPVIIKNALCGTALSDWNINYLANAVGDKEVRVNVFSSGEERERTYQQILFKELADAINSGKIENGEMYLQQCDITKQFPELLPDIPIDKLLYSDLDSEINLWAGPKGTTVPLHFDLMNNLFVQLEGEKEFILYPASDTKWVYPHPINGDTGVLHVSQVDIYNFDKARFPDFIKATPTVLTLKAGEMLFLPSGMWHKVSSVSNSLSLNFWWNVIDSQLWQASNARTFPILYPRLKYVHEKSIKREGGNLISIGEHLIKRFEYMAAFLCYLLELEDALSLSSDKEGAPYNIDKTIDELDSRIDGRYDTYNADVVKGYFLTGKKIINREYSNNQQLKDDALSISQFIKPYLS